MLRYLPLLLLLACNDRPPTTPETRPVENPNAGNTAIYDVDADDPYEVGNGSFLDLTPGQTVSSTDDRLEQTEEGYNLLGRKGERLGTVTFDKDNRIKRITITSAAVVSRYGIRVGLSYPELIERTGATMIVHPEDYENYAVHDGLLFALSQGKVHPNDRAFMQDTTVKVTAILIE